MQSQRGPFLSTTTADEIKQVLIVDFEHVTERNGVMLFRRPKRFSKVLV